MSPWPEGVTFKPTMRALGAFRLTRSASFLTIFRIASPQGGASVWIAVSVVALFAGATKSPGAAHDLVREVFSASCDLTLRTKTLVTILRDLEFCLFIEENETKARSKRKLHTNLSKNVEKCLVPRTEHVKTFNTRDCGLLPCRIIVRFPHLRCFTWK